MTGDSANFADALLSGRFSTAWLWIGPSLDRRTPKSEVTAFLWCNSLIGSDAYLSLVIIVFKEKTNKYSNLFFYYGKNWYCKNLILQIWTKLGNKHWELKWQKLSRVFQIWIQHFLCYSSTFAIVEKCHSELPLSCHLMGVVPTYFKLLDFFNYHPLHTSCDIFFVRITN